MIKLFEADDSDAVLLVDADNAFNRLNRLVALKNMHIICPTLAIYATNCYQSSARLFVTGGAELQSQEGTTQGDPLSMPFYALSVMPLIWELRDAIHQIWYADDAQATGSLTQLRKWWDTLVLRGPGYGYFVNATKSILVVKPQKIEEAKSTFHDTRLQIQEGARYLGGAIGTASYVQNYVADSVSKLFQTLRYHILKQHTQLSCTPLGTDGISFSGRYLTQQQILPLWRTSSRINSFRRYLEAVK